MFITKKIHYNRNDFQKDKTFATLEEAKANGYVRHLKGKPIEEIETGDNYHEMGDEHDGTIYGNGNDKYILLVEGTKESCELVFDKEGKLVTDSVNLGTYNFRHSDGTFLGWWGHAFKDVIPYYFWGNDEVDKGITTFWERVFGNYKGDIPKGDLTK